MSPERGSKTVTTVVMYEKLHIHNIFHMETNKTRIIIETVEVGKCFM